MELWHVLNHSIESRDLFLDTQDYARFVHNLYEFNDTAPASNFHRSFDPVTLSNHRCPSSKKERKRLVDIHAWTLMKDHYHLLLSERVEHGIPWFLRKLNAGFAKYYNERYHRNGTLFRSKTKKVLIEREAHFLYILHYIHLNPLDYMSGAERWRFRSAIGILNARKALEYLYDYRWSSYLDYTGKKNFPSILTTSLFRESLGDPVEALRTYLRDAEQDSSFFGLILE